MKTARPLGTQQLLGARDALGLQAIVNNGESRTCEQHEHTHLPHISGAHARRADARSRHDRWEQRAAVPDRARQPGGGCRPGPDRPRVDVDALAGRRRRGRLGAADPAALDHHRRRPAPVRTRCRSLPERRRRVTCGQRPAATFRVDAPGAVFRRRREPRRAQRHWRGQRQPPISDAQRDDARGRHQLAGSLGRGRRADGSGVRDQRDCARTDLRPARRDQRVARIGVAWAAGRAEALLGVAPGRDDRAGSLHDSKSQISPDQPGSQHPAGRRYTRVS